MKQFTVKYPSRWITLGALAAVTTLGSLSTLAGGLEQNHISADAKWLMHLDVDGLLKSKVGSYLNEKVLEPKIQLQKSMVEGMLGVTLKADLVHSITIYGTSYEKNPQQNAAVLIHTDIDIAGIVKKVREFQNLEASQSGQAPDQKLKELQSKPYPMYWMKGDDGDVYFANPSKGLWALAMNQDQLKSAITVIQGKALSLTSNSELQNLGEAKQSIMFLAMAKGFNEHTILPPQAQILKMAGSGMLTFGESGENLQVKINMTANTQEAAAQMAQLAQGMIALATLSQSDNPEVMELARGAKVSQDKSQVSLTVAYPIAKVLAKIKEEMIR
jgi:hypothetical protein